MAAGLQSSKALTGSDGRASETGHHVRHSSLRQAGEKSVRELQSLVTRLSPCLMRELEIQRAASRLEDHKQAKIPRAQARPSQAQAETCVHSRWWWNPPVARALQDRSEHTHPAWLLFHANKMSQKTGNKMYMVQNCCCLPSTPLSLLRIPIWKYTGKGMH